jgi:DHA3 family macrolide efflux protein-like MFS transporter
MPQTKSIWKSQNFILYFFGTFISKLGDKIYLIAMPWLIYDLTGSALGMGLMFLIESFPFLIMSPIAGVIADRFSRKTILSISASVQAICIATVPVLHYLSVLEIWHIYIIGFILSSAGACFAVVNGTIIPDLFSKDQLIKVNSIFQFMETSSQLIGAAVAGVLIGFIGVFGALWIDAVSFVAIITAMLLLKMQANKPVAIRSSSWEQLREGFQYVVRHPAIGPLALLTLLVNIANASLIAMLVFFARDELSLTAQQIGWVYSGAAVASLIATLLIPKLNRKNKSIELMLVNLLVSSLGIVWVSLSWGFIGLLLGIALQSAPVIMSNVLNRTLRQRIVPSNILGRVNGINLMLSRTAFPLAGFLSGFMTDIFNVRYVLFTLGLLTFFVVILFWLSPLRKYEEEHTSLENTVSGQI